MDGVETVRNEGVVIARRNQHLRGGELRENSAKLPHGLTPHVGLLKQVPRDEDKLGPTPRTALAPEEYAKNNLPDVLARWQQRDSTERERPRTAQSFCVPKADIAAQGYDLSLNRYKEVVREEMQHRPPQDILADLARLETEIQRGMGELQGMLK